MKILRLLTALGLLFYSNLIYSEIVSSVMTSVVADETTIADDLKLILKSASLPTDLISFSREDSENGADQVHITCTKGKYHLQVSAKASEWGSTFYFGLQKLGFYFIHPRMTVTPDREKLSLACGKTYLWKPAFKYRGFHFHTLHPNEWVHGFLMGKTEIANDTVRWLARNYQNVFDVNLLRMKKKKIYKNLKKPFELSKKLGVFPGISIGAALHQQNNYKLLNLFRATTGLGSQKVLKRNIRELSKNIDFSFMTMEAGTTEFTPVKYERALSWMDNAADVLDSLDRQLFIKVHVSSNQHHPDYGNFNFLPQYAKPTVGVFPHTVMFYGLYDENVPMYGNGNFHSIRNFALKEMVKRPTWYYPETSYFILMDIDVPLLLTDYLVTRAVDMDKLASHGLEGHMNFTTGHELGYWMIDWTVALLANSEYQFDPLAAVKLLGEDVQTWEKIVDFQTRHIKNNGLIAMLSGANFQDEISKKHRIHERNLLKELHKDPLLLAEEIELLNNAVIEIPDTEKIKNRELKELVEVTFLRIHHALELRLALQYQKKSPEREHHLNLAKMHRLHAESKTIGISLKHDRYPKAGTFKRHTNPTSYQFGYGYTARTLHVWKREEAQVRREKWSPFFMNIFNILDILL